MVASIKDANPWAVTAAVAVAHLIVLGAIRYKIMKDNCDKVVIGLPDWAKAFYESYKDKIFTSEEEMMKVAIEVSDKNVHEKTGGPFGTAIFECDTKTGECKLFSIGMNQVVPFNNSTLHGEMVAIQFGQKKLKEFTFRAKQEEGKEYHLYTSCEPCCQCLGGTLWSGVSKLVCAAAKDDAEALGFDEGPVFEESYKALESAGIKVVRGCLREKGARVLRRYGETGVIYNASASDIAE
mmetsp:Transcript_27366/g.51326  ORF Transcript_27366/g.51326 Transcript_27366/m.51326 type:complete len:238 (+) Transcript_27366:154-867(+)|eukprot:CAMPEP_0178752926 /NCGR_PEP_ID=MMETSP0744-20121128/11335_1 /TAXON_ID=913974 /ORGANISM="Nitzschia punctata, Strain CCMP561" /LENGTH=237 /DNA_ID=CAMNT_0020406701 /DNA_START=110 /DNA_END=823 /DNA_ORIENTATION=+